eukprot:TRINITY_DN112103_c0_g1_i1.p1 TRINITY_DN112103_c0_g1~~TRINITY_DN112103_c0_g1_i1.p1  ORF type:complete len:437 (+),score=47.63 TRINITY_DN112103_c0_g1_i1:75-1385(+)
MRQCGVAAVTTIVCSIVATSMAEAPPVQMDCPVCAGTSIQREYRDLMSTQEAPGDWACLDAEHGSTLVKWLYKRDTADTMKFAPFDDRLNVTVDIDIMSLWAIDQKSQEYKLRFQTSMSWKSCPMVFHGESATKGTGVLVLSGDQSFWKPVFDFDSLHSEEKDAAGDQSFWILHSDGTVMFSQVKICTFHCHFDFTDLPNDVQTCALKMTPLRESSDYLNVQAGDLSLPEGGVHSEEWQISNFDLTRHDVRKVTRGGIDRTFSQLTMQFKLTRDPQFYMISVVCPTVVVWGISYAGMFIPMAALPARAALAAIPVLIGINTQTRVLSGLPPISYFTWLDRFLMCVQIMLLAHMMEYALVAYCIATVARIEKKMAAAKKSDEVLPSAAGREEVDKAERPPRKYLIAKWIAEHFEGYFRVVALVAFLITLTVHTSATS